MNQAAARPVLGFWPALVKLLRLRVLIAVSSFRRASTRGKIGTATLGLLLLALLVGAFLGSRGLLKLLRSPEAAAVIPEMEAFLATVPVLVLEAGFLLILLTSFGVLLQGLYLAGDMDFLLSAPVPIRAVFASKLLQAILPNLALFSLVAVPVLYGLGAASGYGLLYYLLIPITLVALALAAAGLASLVVMLVVRVFPARRVAEVLGFAGALVSLICSQSGQFTRGAKVSPDQAASALRLLARLDVPWSPLAWSGRGLVGLGEGRWLAGAGSSLLGLSSACLVFLVALTASERFYYSGWAATRTVQRRKRIARPARNAARRRTWLTARLLPPAVEAIVAKDWKVLRRDLRNLSQLVTPLILGVVYAFMLMRGDAAPPIGEGDAPPWLMLQSLIEYGNVAISLFVGWALLGRLAAMGFSQEGRSYWLLKSAPVSVGQLLAAKFIVAYLPAVALSGGFAAVLALLRGQATLWYSLALVALCLAAATGVCLAFGVAGARLEWEDPRQMVSGGTGCLTAIASALVVAVALAFFAVPQIGLTLLGWPLPAAQLVGLVLGGAFCLAGALVPLWLVRDRVPQLGES